jgi:hypothetical protein
VKTGVAILFVLGLARAAWAQTPDDEAWGAAPRRASSDWPGDEEAKADFQRSRPAPDLSPASVRGRFGSAQLYGFGELDWIHDSTQSFDDVGAFSSTLARPQTVAGDYAQDQVTLCDSRLGLRLETPDDRRVRGTFLVELAPELTGAVGQDDRCYHPRVRHLYVALRSPIVDVLAGRYYALFGWGGKGFLPNTAAFLGVPGELYHREPQVRVSHIFRFSPVDFEIAGALARSDDVSDGGELHLAVRLAVNRWRGGSAQGGGPPAAAPLQIGFSGVGRTVQMNAFTGDSTAKVSAYGRGLAFDAFLPAIPARGDDLGNSLSFTLELVTGRGLADMYSALTGGVLFPALPNPAGRQDPTNPPPIYVANAPASVATFDAEGRLQLVDWCSAVGGAQYHLPFARGRRVWVSGTLSFLRSSNVRALTPLPGLGGVWDRGWYYDLNVFVSVISPLQLAASYEITHQTFLDEVEASNARALVSATYFF